MILKWMPKVSDNCIKKQHVGAKGCDFSDLGFYWQKVGPKSPKKQKKGFLETTATKRGRTSRGQGGGGGEGAKPPAGLGGLGGSEDRKEEKFGGSEEKREIYTQTQWASGLIHVGIS